MNHRIFVALLALALHLPLHAAPGSDTALHTLFDQRWQEQAERTPEWATYRGDLRFNDRLADRSPAARAAEDAADRRWLERARAWPRDGLAAGDRLSLDMFVDGLERQVEQQAFEGWRGMLVRSLGGPQNGFADLMLVVPMGTEAQARQLLSRMAQFPGRMDEDIAIMRRSQALGWVPARDVLLRALAQIDAQLALPPADSPYAAPFKRLGRAIPADRQAALQEEGRAAVLAQVLPALRRLRAYLADEALPKAPADGALLHYPGGPAVYAQVVRHMTTTTMTPEQIHAIGQRELTRLRGEMEATMREAKFEGDFAAWVKYLTTDPRFFNASPEALLEGYRALGKRFDAAMPQLFATLPRLPWGVRAMPAFRGPDAAEYYDRPDEAGTRPGWFNANAAGYKRRPTWAMATLTAHEAVPGHHLQSARALELAGLPAFRRNGWYPAYSEGWALYAETLGLEIGLYDDPYVRFGHLQAQAFRAARLVVDTGIHALGWKRQQAIDFMVERTGQDRGFITSEVDRYTSNPGQALTYMIGQLKIRELREKAQAALGPKFDLRRFHDAVIDQGPMPLDLLEQVITAWVDTQRR